MKFSHFLSLLTLITLLGLMACNSKKEDATTTDPNATVSPEGGQVMDPAANPSTATASTGTEAHYKCSKAGCTGTGDAQGKCPVCGSDLVHNQAFHAQSAGTPPGTSPTNPVQVNPTTTPGATPNANATATPPAAKNAKGEFHYKCPNGHDGAATAGNCAKCGTALVHNQAYHNQ